MGMHATASRAGPPRGMDLSFQSDVLSPPDPASAGAGTMVALSLGRGECEKGIWWMPWRREAMKDVARCVKPRGAASRLRSGDLRMGQPDHLGHPKGS